MTYIYHSNGKLLLTGEYLVLDGALALACPTTFGQSLKVTPNDSGNLRWKSLDLNGEMWFETTFQLGASGLNTSSKNKTSNRLLELLTAARELNPGFLAGSGYAVISELEFPLNWGLGSSSTLVNNIARWSNTDPFKLLERSFGGSGYDVAAANALSPILYSLQPERTIQSLDLNWSFTNKIYFVHLNRKQNSRSAMAHYTQQNVKKENTIKAISQITRSIVSCDSIQEFESLMTEHESIVSGIIDTPTIKEQLFSDFSGVVKSLGAWGGDFILVTGDKGDLDYFSGKGFNTIIPFDKMVK